MRGSEQPESVDARRGTTAMVATVRLPLIASMIAPCISPAKDLNDSEFFRVFDEIQAFHSARPRRLSPAALVSSRRDRLRRDRGFLRALRRRALTHARPNGAGGAERPAEHRRGQPRVGGFEPDRAPPRERRARETLTRRRSGSVGSA